MNRLENRGSSQPPTSPGPTVGIAEHDDHIVDLELAQESLADRETDTVNILILIGSLMASIKPGAGGKWPSSIARLGYKARAARRLRAIGRVLGGEDGKAPDLAELLPANIGKLVQLARLERGQLRAFVTGLDCRRATLKAITAAVGAALETSARPASVAIIPGATPAAVREQGVGTPIAAEARGEPLPS